MATPEIVLGASLLTLFVGTATEPWHTLTGGSLFPLGSITILIAHVMFNISYVVVTVRARMQGFPRHLEEAAMDLGANEWTTFWKVTFPLIFPGILAAALLAFSLSIDDFMITNFTAGTTNDLPGVGLRRDPERHSAANSRHRHRDLRGRCRAGRALASSQNGGARAAPGRPTSSWTSTEARKESR